jgi:hypothetical protein
MKLLISLSLFAIAIAMCCSAYAQVVDVKKAEDISRSIGWEWNHPIESENRNSDEGVLQCFTAGRADAQSQVCFSGDGRLISAARLVGESYDENPETWKLKSRMDIEKRVAEVLEQLRIVDMRVNNINLPDGPKARLSRSVGLVEVELTDTDEDIDVPLGTGNFLYLQLIAKNGNLMSLRGSSGWTYSPTTPKLSSDEALKEAATFLVNSGVDVDRKKLTVAPVALLKPTDPGSETEAGRRYRLSRSARLGYSVWYDQRLLLEIDATTGEVLGGYTAKSIGTVPGDQAASESNKLDRSLKLSWYRQPAIFAIILVACTTAIFVRKRRMKSRRLTSIR